MKEVFQTESGHELVIIPERIELTKFNGNTIYFGKSNGEDIVIKFSAHPWGARREWEALQKISVTGINSPMPIDFIYAERPGVAMTFISGSDLYLDPDLDKRRKLGGIVKTMHNIVCVDGNEWVRSGKKDFTYYDRKIDQWRETGLGGSAPAALRSLSKSLGDSFSEINPAFLHNDLHDGQVIVSGDNLVLIDFEFWREGHPMSDLSSYLLHIFRHNVLPEYFAEFAEGYVGDGGYDEKAKEAILFLLLFQSCQALEFFYDNKPNELEIAVNQHKKALKYFKEEVLYRTI